MAMERKSLTIPMVLYKSVERKYFETKDEMVNKSKLVQDLLNLWCDQGVEREYFDAVMWSKDSDTFNHTTTLPPHLLPQIKSRLANGHLLKDSTVVSLCFSLYQSGVFDKAELKKKLVTTPPVGKRDQVVQVKMETMADFEDAVEEAVNEIVVKFGTPHTLEMPESFRTKLREFFYPKIFPILSLEEKKLFPETAALLPQGLPDIQGYESLAGILNFVSSEEIVGVWVIGEGPREWGEEFSPVPEKIKKANPE